MSEHSPYIDFENLPNPSEGFIVTLFITVRSIARSRAFYSEVLGGQVVLEENPCIIKLANSWLLWTSWVAGPLLGQARHLGRRL